MQDNTISRRSSKKSLAESIQEQQELIEEHEKKVALKRTQTISQKKLKQQKLQINKEQSIREIFGFYTNQIDVKRFFQNKKKKGQKDDHIAQDEKIQDDFLNPNEFQEIKDIYEDYNMGDLALVFPNPDDEQAVNDSVSFTEAEQIYDKILTVLTDEVSKSQMKKERDSFLLSFLTLKDYEEENKKGKNLKRASSVKIKQKDLKQKEISKSHKDINSIPKKPHINQNEIINSGQSINVQNSDEAQPPQEETSYQKYQKFMKMYSEVLKKEEKEYQSQMKEAQEREGLSFSEIAFSQQFYRKQEKNRKIGDFIIDPLKEILKVDLSNTKQFREVKKQLCCGKFLYKQFNEDGTDYDWFCTNQPPNDFLTLIRSTVINKLSRNAFLHCRQFVSSTGKHIFIVIKSVPEVISRQAQKMKITKQIEMGFADLFSLEPVDGQFRPLRLKNYVRAINDDIQSKLDQQQFEHYKWDPNEAIDEYCKKLYIKVQQWKGIDLRLNVIRKQMEIDVYLRQIAKELNIDQSHEKVELIDDLAITDEEWQVYYIYMEFIVCFSKQIEKAKEKDYREVIENQAFLYKLIFLKAMGDSNEFWYAQHSNFWKEFTGNKAIIFSLWGRLDISPVPPYTEYFKSQGDAGASLWRKFEINQKGGRSEFINMEKIRITNAIILKHINILKMLQRQLVIAYFPIHDCYQLLGNSKVPLFEPLEKHGFIINKPETDGHAYLKMMFDELADEAEATDFDSESVQLESQFNIRIPWHIPIDSVRDYFGEKIALYFDFLSYYTKQLWYMAIIGIITQGMMASSNLEVRSTVIIGFSIIIIIWSTVLMEFWKREQVLFTVKFGQQNFEADEAERPAFEGQFLRSVVNDDLNEEFYSPFIRKMKQLLALTLSFIIIMCVVGCVFGIFFLKNQMIEQNVNQQLTSILPNILQTVSISIFNIIYDKVGMITNEFENHKILSSFENLLVTKLTVFRFVNGFIQFFITSFLSDFFPQLNLCKVTATWTNCFQVLQNQMTSIFLTMLITMQIPKLISPIIVTFIQKLLTKKDLTPVPHPFNAIDQLIEEDFSKGPYQTNEEIDGTFNDYMGLIIQFSYLSLFGLAFPACYLLGFIQNVVKIQVDKYNFIKISRRPFPQGAASLGNWLIIFEMISFLAIFTNAGLIVFTSEIITTNQAEVFTILLIAFLAVKYLIRFLIPDEPAEALILNKRHEVVVEKAVKGFQNEGNQRYHMERVNRSVGGIRDAKIKGDTSGQSLSSIDS